MPLFAEDPYSLLFQLTGKSAFERSLVTWDRKFAQIDLEFYQAEVVTDEIWKELGRSNVSRGATQCTVFTIVYVQYKGFMSLMTITEKWQYVACTV